MRIPNSGKSIANITKISENESYKNRIQNKKENKICNGPMLCTNFSFFNSNENEEENETSNENDQIKNKKVSNNIPKERMSYTKGNFFTKKIQQRKNFQ